MTITIIFKEGGILSMAHHTVREFVAYSYILSHPFATFIDAYPMLQSQWLIEEAQQQIAYGNHSSVTRIIQHKLNDLKYYDEEVDGKYGLYTEYALKKFQRDHLILADGVLSSETIIAIVEAEHQYFLDQIKATETPFYYGEKSDRVEALQRALFYLGYLEDQIDGIFGPITERALLNVERAFGLKESLTVSAELVDSIVNEATLEIEQNPVIVEQSKIKPVEKNQTATMIGHLIEDAKDQKGIRYLWGGESPKGFDCSGFVQYVFNNQNVQIPRTVANIWKHSAPVDQPSIGDLVFFETYQKGPSHLGIYLGNGEFIHAGESKGVTISGLNEEYWESRYLGSRRIQMIE